MVHTAALLATIAATLALHVQADHMYGKRTSVLDISGIDYHRVIAKSNYTSPAYETAAASLAGVAKVAAVNCDDEMNRPFCGRMGVQGFPTLKIVRPGKTSGKPTVEDYEGSRSAKAIVEVVRDKVPNIVKRIADNKLDGWLEENKDSAKAILFSEKGVVSATLRALAIDFAGLIPIAQVKKSERGAVERFSITRFPTLILIPAGSETHIKHDGKVEKMDMIDFLSQVAPPHLDCPPPGDKKAKSKQGDVKASKSSSKFESASASQKSADASSAAASAKEEIIEEPIAPVESPHPNIKDDDTPSPIELPKEDLKPTIPVLTDSADVESKCLNQKSKPCILAILPKDELSEDATTILASLASIHTKHSVAGGHLFPFVGVAASNPMAVSIRDELSLGTDEQVHLIATNGKRAWYKKYTGTTFGMAAVEHWVDAIRMGEGTKETLPGSLLGVTEHIEL